MAVTLTDCEVDFRDPETVWIHLPMGTTTLELNYEEVTQLLNDFNQEEDES